MGKYLALSLAIAAHCAAATVAHAYPDDAHWHEELVKLAKEKGANHKVIYGIFGSDMRCRTAPFPCAKQLHVYGRLKSSADMFSELMGPQHHNYVLGWYSISSRADGHTVEKPFFFMISCDTHGIRVVEARESDYEDPDGAVMKAPYEYADGTMREESRAIYKETSKTYCDSSGIR